MWQFPSKCPIIGTLEISVSFAYDRYFFGSLRRQDSRSNQNSSMATNPYPLDYINNAIGNDNVTGGGIEINQELDPNNDASGGTDDATES